MKPFQELYPDVDMAQSYPYIGNYQPIIEAIGDVVIQVDDNDYQGDSRILFKKNEEYGYLIFGWGSCSGCDALLGCNTADEVYKLACDLEDEVKWGSAADILEYFKTKDWELEYAWHADETKKFIAGVISHLESL